MTREHLVEDIQNVLELINQAAADSTRHQPAHAALQGLYRHIQNAPDVPGTVEGCLREAVSSIGESSDTADPRIWRSARACLETALEFANES